MSRRDEIIERFKRVHGDRFDYSELVYVNNTTKMKIKCIKHNTFFYQIYKTHIKSKHCCPTCELESRIKITQYVFIEKSKIEHNNKYLYDKVIYIDLNTKVTIGCPEHGYFDQLPNNHLNNKQGCLICKTKNSRISPLDFIKRSKLIHNNIYDYSLVEYDNFHFSNNKVKIICRSHGTFEQIPNEHCNNEKGCPKCKQSSGEREIESILIKNNLEYIREKQFETCKNIKELPFDFYLIKENVLIEFNGIQHYKCVEIFGGQKVLTQQRKNDLIKKKWAKENNIKLIVIPYTEKNLEEIIKKELSIKT